MKLQSPSLWCHGWQRRHPCEPALTLGRGVASKSSASGTVWARSVWQSSGKLGVWTWVHFMFTSMWSSGSQAFTWSNGPIITILALAGLQPTMANFAAGTRISSVFSSDAVLYTVLFLANSRVDVWLLQGSKLNRSNSRKIMMNYCTFSMDRIRIGVLANFFDDWLLMGDYWQVLTITGLLAVSLGLCP